VKRTRINAMSEKRRARQEEGAKVRQQVFQRDRFRCLLDGRPHPTVPRCHGPATVHHMRKAGQGGAYSMVNLVTLCAGHNDWLEEADGARFGEAVGLVIRRGTTHDEAWAALEQAGLVTYGPGG